MEVKKPPSITSFPLLCYFCGKPIIKMRGRDTDSYCNHHVSYNPEITVPAHIGCNIGYHSRGNTYASGTEKSLKRKETLKSLYSEKELLCHFCGKPIIKMNGLDSKSLLIHSLDGNNSNWDPSNKVLTHRGCHQIFHLKGTPRSEETKQKISEAKKGKPQPWCEGEKSNFYGIDRSGDKSPMYGKHHTEEARKKIGIANTGPENNKKAWKTRRKRYGPSGYEDVDVTWKKRRELYGPSGYKDPGVTWKHRRERYGPTGRKPKVKEEK